MGTSVLSVADHEGLRHQARSLLREAGFEIVGSARRAPGAAAATRTFRPDPVVLAVRRPDGGGSDTSALGGPHRPTVAPVPGSQPSGGPARVGPPGPGALVAGADLGPESGPGVQRG